jgi:hypothetical protein
VKRFLATIAIPVAALGGLGLVACSDDDDDEPDTTVSDTVASTDTEPTDDTEASTDDEPSDDTAITLPDISLPDVSVPGGTLPGGITIPDFTLPDISLPDVSVPDVTEILGQIFPGLDDTQLECLADGLGDVSEIDTSRVMDLLDDCNINLSDLTGGG